MKIFSAAALLLSLTVPALAQTAIPALPKEMLGVWGFAAADCKDEDSDGRLLVEAKRVASFAAVFKLGEIRTQPDGGVKAAAARFDEGEQRRPRASLELRLIAPDKLHVKTNQGEEITYSRCKPASRANSKFR